MATLQRATPQRSAARGPRSEFTPTKNHRERHIPFIGPAPTPQPRAIPAQPRTNVRKQGEGKLHPRAGTEQTVEGTEFPREGKEFARDGTEQTSDGKELPRAGTEQTSDGTQFPLAGTELPHAGIELPLPERWGEGAGGRVRCALDRSIDVLMPSDSNPPPTPSHWEGERSRTPTPPLPPAPRARHLETHIKYNA